MRRSIGVGHLNELNRVDEPFDKFFHSPVYREHINTYNKFVLYNKTIPSFIQLYSLLQDKPELIHIRFNLIQPV